MEHLLAHVLKLKRLQLYLQFDRPLGEHELAPLRELMKRRAAGEPLQHLLGEWDFCGHQVKCDSRGLIPRPETEELVDWCLKRLKDQPPQRLLDMGTGSGVIGLTLLKGFPQAQGTLVDISTDALALAQENAELLGVTDRVEFIQSDLWTNITARYDLVLANLPYIPSAMVPTLSREVQHDPLLALDGGQQGDEIIQRFIAGLRPHLTPGARVALEVHFDQPPRIAQALTQAGLTEVETSEDFSGFPRFVYGKEPA